MKIEDMVPGKLYRVTRTDGPMEFAYGGATGLAIVHAPGEPDSQSSIAVPPGDCSPWETAAPVRVLLFDEDAQRTGPFRTFYDPNTGERFRVSDLTLATLPTTASRPKHHNPLAAALIDALPYASTLRRLSECADVPPAKPTSRPRMHITELRQKVGGGSSAVTKLDLDAEGYVREVEVTNCFDERWLGGRFGGAVPNPQEAFERCLLHGAPSLKRDEHGQFNQAELEAARAKFFGVTS